MPEQISLYKRHNGFYYIFYHENGRKRWKSTGCRRKPDALTALANFDDLIKEKQKPILLSRFSQEFLSFSASVHSRRTTSIYELLLRRLLAFTGDRSLITITTKHADAYKAERLKCVSPVSVNKEIAKLRATFATAVRWEMIERNPFREVPFVPVAEKAPAYFTKQHFERLLAFLPNETLRRLVVVAVHTGLRRGELLNLQWRHVDLEQRYLIVESSPTFKTKAGKRRIVPLNDTALTVLRSLQTSFISEYVFTVNGERLNEDYLTHRFKKAVRAAGLPDSLHFHSLRHTFASWIVQSGESLYAVQKLLGHSDATVTQIYSHLAPAELRGAVNKITFTLN